MLSITNQLRVAPLFLLVIPAAFQSGAATLFAGNGEPKPSNTPAEFARRLGNAFRVIGDNHYAHPSEAQMVRWSISGLYRAVGEPVPPAIAGRLDKLRGAKSEEVQQLLRDARAHLGARKELVRDMDLDIGIEAILAQLEPGVKPQERPSQLISRDQFRCNLFRQVVGVGLELESDPASGMIRVVTPIYNSPAHKAGIRAGDIITHIRHDTNWRGDPLIGEDNLGKPVPVSKTYSTRGMTVERAAELLLGKEGTQVFLTVVPAPPVRMKAP